MGETRENQIASAIFFWLVVNGPSTVTEIQEGLSKKENFPSKSLSVVHYYLKTHLKSFVIEDRTKKQYNRKSYSISALHLGGDYYQFTILRLLDVKSHIETLVKRGVKEEEVRRKLRINRTSDFFDFNILKNALPSSENRDKDGVSFKEIVSHKLIKFIKSLIKNDFLKYYPDATLEDTYDLFTQMIHETEANTNFPKDLYLYLSLSRWDTQSLTDHLFEEKLDQIKEKYES